MTTSSSGAFAPMPTGMGHLGTGGNTGKRVSRAQPPVIMTVDFDRNINQLLGLSDQPGKAFRIRRASGIHDSNGVSLAFPATGTISSRIRSKGARTLFIRKKRTLRPFALACRVPPESGLLPSRPRIVPGSAISSMSLQTKAGCVWQCSRICSTARLSDDLPHPGYSAS